LQANEVVKREDVLDKVSSAQVFVVTFVAFDEWRSEEKVESEDADMGKGGMRQGIGGKAVEIREKS
jgi:hypothetical protein